MVKSVLGANQGLRDWVIQRMSAIVMAVYSIGLIAYLVCHPNLYYAEWRAIFAHTGMKIATMLFLLSLMLHAWIGMWTIFTDYVKPAALNIILQVLAVLMLAACFIWGALILWSL